MRRPLSSGVGTRLHLGAHRTATTALQDTLRAAEHDLAQEGVVALLPWSAGHRDAPGLRRVSAIVTKAARRRGLGAWKHRQAARSGLKELLGGRHARVLILSDENFLGEPFAPDGTALYPDCARRLAALARVLDRPPARVHLTIRTYDTFIPSVFAMSAVHKTGVAGFDSLRPHLLRLDRGWPEVVADIRTIFPAARLTLARYERDPTTETLHALLDPPLAAALAPRVPVGVNASPSQPALQAAASARGVGKAGLDAVTARSTPAPRFDPLDGAEAERLRARYVADLERLNGLSLNILGSKDQR